MASILVLAECGDLLALRVIRALNARGASVQVLTPMQLALASSWAHRVDGTTVSTELRIDDRTVAPPDAVLNRLYGARFFPGRVWRTAEDATYAEGEFGALIVSWLASVGGLVLGPPNTGTLHHHPGALEWTTLALEAGLPVRQMTWTTDASCVTRRDAMLLDPFDPERQISGLEARLVGRRPVISAEPVQSIASLFVVGGRAIGVPDARLASGLARLSASSGYTLLECRFGRVDQGDRRWVFSGARVPFPDAPATVVSAIADTLLQASAVAA
jgi:hypothetical protein